MLRVLTVGCFDLLHEGHAKLLHSMKLQGEVIVALHSCRSIYHLKNRFPVQGYDHREKNLLLSGLVDEVVQVKEQDPSRVIRMLLDGGDWVYMRADDMPEFPGRQAVIEAGVPIVLHPYTQGVCSTELRPCPDSS